MKKAPSDSAGDVELVVEQVRLTKARADKLELELREKEKELIPVVEVEKLWSKVVADVRARLLAIPSAVAPTVALLGEPTDVEEHLTAVIEDALGELARGAIG